MASHNLDMCAFLRQNPDFINITQTTRIAKEDVKLHVPKSMKFDIYENQELDGDRLMEEIFSDDDEEEEAEDEN